MFWIVIFLSIAAVIGGSVAVGLMRPQEARGRPRHGRGAPATDARGRRRLTNQEKLDLAKVAGVLPSRKEN